MTLTKDETFRALGIDPIEDKGSNESEIAEQTPTEEGSKEPEIADPVDDDDTNDADEPKQSSEENKKYQAARKKAEEEAKRIKAEADARIAEAEKKAQEKLQSEIDAFYAKQNKTNPFKDDAPITNKSEWEEFESERRKRELRQSGLDPDLLSGILEEERQKIQAETKAEIEKVRFEAQVKAELDEIKKLDPDIHSIADILSQPYADAFKAKVNSGYTYLDAFKLESDYAEKREKAAQESSLTKQASKQHLTPPGNRGGNNKDYPMTPSQKEAFRRLNPSWTDRQVQDYYNKQQSSKEGG